MKEKLQYQSYVRTCNKNKIIYSSRFSKVLLVLIFCRFFFLLSFFILLSRTLFIFIITGFFVHWAIKKMTVGYRYSSSSIESSSNVALTGFHRSHHFFQCTTKINFSSYRLLHWPLTIEMNQFIDYVSMLSTFKFEKLDISDLDKRIYFFLFSNGFHKIMRIATKLLVFFFSFCLSILEDKYP